MFKQDDRVRDKMKSPRPGEGIEVTWGTVTFAGDATTIIQMDVSGEERSISTEHVGILFEKLPTAGD